MQMFILNNVLISMHFSICVQNYNSPKMMLQDPGKCTVFASVCQMEGTAAVVVQHGIGRNFPQNQHRVIILFSCSGTAGIYF